MHIFKTCSWPQTWICQLYCLWYKHLLWLKKACWFDFSFNMLFSSNFTIEIWIGILGFLSFRALMPTKTALKIQQFLGISETREFWTGQLPNIFVDLPVRLLGLQGCCHQHNIHLNACRCMYHVMEVCFGPVKPLYLPGPDILLKRISGLYFTWKLWILDIVAC